MPPRATAHSATCASIRGAPARTAPGLPGAPRAGDRHPARLQSAGPDLPRRLGARPWGVRYVFDHHDICPELYETKFGRRGALWRMMVLVEWLTFRSASVSIATNEILCGNRAAARQHGGWGRVRGPLRPEDRQAGAQAPEARVETGGGAPDRLRRGDRPAGGARPPGRGRRPPDPADGSRRTCISASSAAVRRSRRSGPRWQRAASRRWFTFTGRAPDDLLLDMLNTADVCVNPDRATPMNDLSTMNKIMEYMTLKKPIVQFDLKKGRASAADASLYARQDDPVDFAEKIAELLDDPALRERMGEIGRPGSKTGSLGRIRRRGCSRPTTAPSPSGPGSERRRRRRGGAAGWGRGGQGGRPPDAVDPGRQLQHSGDDPRLPALGRGRDPHAL